MATLTATNPTMADILKTLDPDGTPAQVIQAMVPRNEILDDVTWVEGNLKTGHRTTVQASLPVPTWRSFNQGVAPTKSGNVQITDNCGMLRSTSQVDKELADTYDDPRAYRRNEDIAHQAGMNKEFVDTLFYGNEETAPKEFTGFAARFSDPSDVYGGNMLAGGGSGTDNCSIWLVGWSPQTCSCIYPKGSTLGLQMLDKGEQKITESDGTYYYAYETWHAWDCGLSVRDWRYIVRIPNIDKSALTKDASAGADLIDLMTQALEIPPELTSARFAFYVPQTIRSFLRRQIVNKVASSTLSMDEVAGRRVVTFDGVPVRRCDALNGDEATISFA